MITELNNLIDQMELHAIEPLLLELAVQITNIDKANYREILKKRIIYILQTSKHARKTTLLTMAQDVNIMLDLNYSANDLRISFAQKLHNKINNAFEAQADIIDLTEADEPTISSSSQQQQPLQPLQLEDPPSDEAKMIEEFENHLKETIIQDDNNNQSIPEPPIDEVFRLSTIRTGMLGEETCHYFKLLEDNFNLKYKEQNKCLDGMREQLESFGKIILTQDNLLRTIVKQNEGSKSLKNKEIEKIRIIQNEQSDSIGSIEKDQSTMWRILEVQRSKIDVQEKIKIIRDIATSMEEQIFNREPEEDIAQKKEKESIGKRERFKFSPIKRDREQELKLMGIDGNSYGVIVDYEVERSFISIGIVRTLGLEKRIRNVGTGIGDRDDEEIEVNVKYNGRECNIIFCVKDEGRIIMAKRDYLLLGDY